MKKFIKRTTAPSTGDINYYSSNNSMVKYGYGLPNCTTYVHGRFAELGADESKLCLGDAKLYYSFNDGFKRSNTPKVGSIACYNGGTYGHVAIVEEVYDNGTMLISESDYVQKITFRTRVVGQKENVYGYALQGFILCPIEFEEEKQEVVAKKTNEEIADEVIAGKWGNGNDRVQALSNAGYDPKTIQDIVNQKMGVQNKKSVDEIALEVIRGEWGNGDERYKRLTEAGYNYNEIQAKVNQLI